MDKSEVIGLVCSAIARESLDEAKQVVRSQYPFEPCLSRTRKISAIQSTEVFIRDGFIDRYSGNRLVFPGTLRLLSVLLPEEFPTHPNWKMSETHIAFWELFPTVDHVYPFARGGEDNESNWVTTSMIRNSAKSNWTLEELGWSLLPRGDFRDWDGLVGWFVDSVENNPQHLENKYLRVWYSAATRAPKLA